MFNTFTILGISVVILALVVFGPLFTIWSLNTLFPILQIAYSLETWAAAAILTAVLNGGLLSFKK